MNSADILLRIHGGSEMERRSKGGPIDRHRRIVDALARCYILETDRIEYDRNMIVPCRTIIPYMEPVTNPDSQWWPWTYTQKYPACATPVREARRKEVLARIAQGKLGIEDRLGPWTGDFWHGLIVSGALRRGTGTELFTTWQENHAALIEDLGAMPLMKRMEPAASRKGLRRIRRCYCSMLPATDPLGPSALAGLFAGAVLRDHDGQTWAELPGKDGVVAILDDWGIPYRPFLSSNRRRVVRVSPLFGALVAHLMPANSAGRALAVRNPGGCPFLPTVLWEMALAAKGRRYMQFPDALPFGISRAGFFRRQWRRRDLHRAGWLELGVRITPKLRGLMVEWYGRQVAARRNISPP